MIVGAERPTNMNSMSNPATPTVSPPGGDSWFALTESALPIAALYEWALRPDCGAVVLFSGTVRNHADGRTGVSLLEYEAYESQVVTKMVAIGDEARTRWPDLGRFGILHRIGAMGVTESSVVVVASSPHRPLAFEAARFGIDALKATVPIWKREHHDGGVDWGLAATDVTLVADLADLADLADPSQRSTSDPADGHSS
jgi:molybdopterin synthase catalytic subunit